VVPGVTCGFAEFVDYDLRRAIGGIAHAQIDNVRPLLTLGQFQRIQTPEKIGRQTRYSLCRLNLEVLHNLILQTNTALITIGQSTPNA
jgi:hypothetical protein